MYRLEIYRRFPIRGSRNRPNKSCLILNGTRAELRQEVNDYLAADAFSYGTVTAVWLFDHTAFHADPLKAKPVATFESPQAFVGAEQSASA